MGIVITVMGAIMAVFIVILLHEFGHFCVAKAFGVKVLRFSIGFGKPLWSHVSRTGTEYVIAILPLGGYVKMLNDREIQVSRAESRHAYNRKPLLTRMAIVLAGPLTNFILAIFVFWIIFLMGVSYIKPVIGKVTPQSAADRSGLQAGHLIKAINGKPIHSWQEVLITLIAQIGDTRALSIITQPPDNTMVLQMHPLSLQDWKLTGREPDPLGSLGITPFQPEVPAVVNKVIPGSSAAHGGLQAGDRILALNHQPIPDWSALADYIHQHPHQEVTLTLQREQSLREVSITLDKYLGVEVKMPRWPKNFVENLHYSVFSAWAPACNQVWDLTVFNGIVLTKMLQGKISLQTLGGPIAIFSSAGQASEAGIRAYLSFIAFISVSLGFINILPIPGLDGGHFLFQLIEGIMRRPISEKYEVILLKIGIFFIILLIFQGTINDIMRLF